MFLTLDLKHIPTCRIFYLKRSLCGAKVQKEIPDKDYIFQSRVCAALNSVYDCLPGFVILAASHANALFLHNA